MRKSATILIKSLAIDFWQGRKYVSGLVNFRWFKLEKRIKIRANLNSRYKILGKWVFLNNTFTVFWINKLTSPPHFKFFYVGLGGILRCRVDWQSYFLNNYNRNPFQKKWSLFWFFLKIDNLQPVSFCS